MCVVCARVGSTTEDFVLCLQAGSFDAAFSMSSFDHDGLGRYGDPLGPDSDLLAMDTVKRLVPNFAASMEHP